MSPVTADPAPAAADKPTRERILEVAERLFADQGYNRVSLRSITAAADANMAAVHYYFRSKEALLKAIFEHRVQPLSEERERRLQDVVSHAGDQPPPVREVLAAFLGPGIRLSATPEGAVFNRLSAICSVDPDPVVKQIVFGVHDSVAQPFVEALRRACPQLDGPTFFVRLQCVFGCMMYLRADNGRVDRLLPNEDGAAARRDYDATLERMLDFVEAGMLADGPRSAK